MDAQPGQPQPPAPPPPDLQFDRVGAAAQSCAACKRPVTGAYYTVNNKVICTPCYAQFHAALNRGSAAGRFFKALGLGLVAAIGGAIVWYAISKLTGYTLGIIAIVVGVAVGAAVRKGSNNRGGIGYQLLAVALTYCCIAATYLPEAFQGMNQARTKHHGTATAHVIATTRPSSTTRPTTAAASADDSTDDEDLADLTDVSDTPDSPIVTAVAAVFVIIITFFAPLILGFSHPIGLLILGFALWEAWKINRRANLAITGPHAIAPAAPPPTA
jgi:hypothetical protein